MAQHPIRSRFISLSVALSFLLLLPACATTRSPPMSIDPTPTGQFVTATYQVPIDNQASFLDVLKQVEDAMRGAGLITAWPAVRLRSKKQPDLILELFQWTDDTSFDKAQETPAVLELWGQLEGLWTDGGFGVDRFPESADFWAQYDSLSP